MERENGIPKEREVDYFFLLFFGQGRAGHDQGGSLAYDTLYMHDLWRRYGEDTNYLKMPEIGTCISIFPSNI